MPVPLLVTRLRGISESEREREREKAMPSQEMIHVTETGSSTFISLNPNFTKMSIYLFRQNKLVVLIEMEPVK